MGQYKVPQNVEAEDKILGPLTLKQFIYAIIGVGFGIATFYIGRVFVPFYIIGAIPTVLFLLLGLYQRQGQPFEALFLALVSYFVKPRQRIWIKEPIAEVFKVEPPKPVIAGPQVDPRQVYGQLEKLSQIVDTRGWSAKQAEIQEPDGFSDPTFTMDDRIGASDIVLPTDITATPPEIGVSDDILDMNNNPSAQNLNQLMEDSVRSIREEAMQKMREQTDSGRTIQPQAQTIATPGVSEMTSSVPADILKSALDNPELKVSQIASQASKYTALPEGETVSVNPNYGQTTSSTNQ